MLSELPFVPHHRLFPLPPQYAWLRKYENEVIQGIVRSGMDGKWVEWGGTQIPLPDDVDIPEGTWIQVHLSSSPKGYEMKIEVLKEPFINDTYQKISGFSSSVFTDKEQAIHALIQQIISQNPELANKAEFLLQLFHDWIDEKNSINYLLPRIMRMIQEAVDKGILEPIWLQIFPNDLNFTEGKIDPHIIRDIFKDQMQFLLLEKKLFQSKDPETHIQNTITEMKDYRTLQTLLKNDTFVHFLKNKGYYTEFQKALDVLFSKTTAHQILNLYNSQYTYMIYELPITLRDGFIRGYVHSYLPRKEEQSRNKQPQYAVMAFDLELINTGKIWIELRWIPDALECIFKINEDKTKEMCNSFVNELEESFKSLGIKNVHFHIENWDGNRLQNLFSFLGLMEGKGWSA